MLFGGDVDISPTLPFDIDASALQEAGEGWWIAWIKNILHHKHGKT